MHECSYFLNYTRLVTKDELMNRLSRRQRFPFFRRRHATLHVVASVGRSVGMSVGWSVDQIFEFQAVFALLLLLNRPRLDCRVSGLVLL